MTESEWLNSTDPQAMLTFLRNGGKAGDRKLRLFAAASFRRLGYLLPDPRQRRGVEVLEQLAEGTVMRAISRAATAEVRQAIPRDERVEGICPTDDPHYVALMLYREFCSSSLGVHAVQATAGLADGTGEQHAQARLIRCILGNPFGSRPPVEAAWLFWNDGTVRKLAEAIYEERAFERVPILADALEEAGCNDADILGHCREQGGVHVRGCWVVDLLLGKE